MAHDAINPVVVTGAFERHNFGDLLMGRIVEFFLRQHGLTPLPASVLAADLRRLGGSWVHAFADLAPCLSAAVPIVHVGGETVPCLLKDALRMNIPASWPAKLAARLARDHDPSGLESRMFAYLTPPEETIRGRHFRWAHRFFHAQGASTLGRRDPGIREAVADHLREACWITAREELSVTSLQEAGVRQARFAWDGAALEPCLGPGGLEALDRLEPRPSSGPLLVQANAGFLREHTEPLANQIAAVAARFSGVRIGLAGLAAHHDTIDSLDSLARTLTKMGCPARVTDNPHANAIVNEIKQAACVVATSLHYRILALTYAVPRVSLLNAKTANWARCCDPAFPSDCAALTVAEAVAAAVDVPAARAIDCARAARHDALTAMQDMMTRVAALARSPDAHCHLPDADTDSLAPLPPDYSVLPRLWIDALGTHTEETAAELAAATAANESSCTTVRRLREELESVHHSPSGRLARFFRK